MNNRVFDHELFVCNCEDTSHQLIITKPVDHSEWDEKEIYLNIHLNGHSFWHRLILAVKFLIGHKSRYGEFDTIILDLDNMKKLRKSLGDSIKAYESHSK
jgi:hypothetical protein